MLQMPMFGSEKQGAWSVTDLTRYVRELLEGDHNLADIWVSGEVSNLSQPRSGHLYFTLKDASTSIKCVMWRNAVGKLRFLPRDGDAVEVHGHISVYEASGTYQLYGDALRLAGEGALYQEYLRLKALLEAEGLFDEERKRPIPMWPARIGIVTSPTGAALHDMLNTLRRRYPLVEVIVAPTQVQGIQAPRGIVQALEQLNEQKPDLILVARGGGSIEDLWAFNDEAVTRAIANSPTPVITGIGHETDFTLSDFAADLRAPTPTAAAELAVPDRLELSEVNAELRRGLARAFIALTAAERWSLQDAAYQLRQLSPQNRIRTGRQWVDSLAHRMGKALTYKTQLTRIQLDGMRSQLASLNPYAILQRGFSVVSKANGEVVRSTTQVSTGDQLTVRVADGSFSTKVTKDGK